MGVVRRTRRRDDDMKEAIRERRSKFGEKYATVEYEDDRSRPRARRKVYVEQSDDGDEGQSPLFRDNRASRMSRLPDARHWRGSSTDQRFKRTVIEVPSKQQWQEWLEDTWGSSMASKSRAIQQHALQYGLERNTIPQPSGGFYRSSSGIVHNPPAHRSSLYMDNEFTCPTQYRSYGYQRNFERSTWRRGGFARQPYVNRWKPQRHYRRYAGYYNYNRRGYYSGYYRGYKRGHRFGYRGGYWRNRKPVTRQQLDRQLEEYMGVSAVKAQLDKQLDSYMRDVGEAA